MPTRNQRNVFLFPALIWVLCFHQKRNFRSYDFALKYTINFFPHFILFKICPNISFLNQNLPKKSSHDAHFGQARRQNSFSGQDILFGFGEGGGGGGGE